MTGLIRSIKPLLVRKEKPIQLQFLYKVHVSTRFSAETAPCALGGNRSPLSPPAGLRNTAAKCRLGPNGCPQGVGM